MRQDSRIPLPVLASWFLILMLGTGGRAQPKKAPVDYVNPNIGGIGQMLQPTQPILCKVEMSGFDQAGRGCMLVWPCR